MKLKRIKIPIYDYTVLFADIEGKQDDEPMAKVLKELNIDGENMTIAKLMERWEAWAVVEGIGKDGINKEQCVIVEVELIEEKKRV